jgi:alcohol dehydrogenase class IV
MNLFGNWNYPTSIRFGLGRIKELSEVCSELGMSNPLLVTDKGLSDLPITLQTQEIMNYSGLGKAKFSEVDENPNEKNLEAGVEQYKAGNHDGVIAFGGGSGLDLGKMIAFMVGQRRPIWDFEDVDDWWTRADTNKIAPIIAIPTTAGTGSEVGRASVITNSKTHTKKIIFHPKVLPSAVICDPELTVSMPKFITAGTGLDAFAHCVEAFSSPNYHPMCQGIALEGMRLIKNYLPRAYLDGNDLEARSNLMCAASMGATAFQKGLGAIHALSHPIGAVYNTHHGTTNAIFMPEVLKFNSSKIKTRFEHVAKYLSINGGFEGFCEFVQNLNDSLKIPRKLSQLGVINPNIDNLTKMALADPSSAGNPVKLTSENVSLLFRASL